MKKYIVVALANLNDGTGLNSWTKGLEYVVIETDTKFQITSNEAQVAYLVNLKDRIMKNFKRI